MKRILVFIVMRMVLALRYRIKVKGFEDLTAERLNKKGGILFLANHPAEIDPGILVRVFWPRFRIHPIAVEYLFQKPIIRFFLEFVGSLPIPSFDSSSNSYKRFRIEKTYAEIFSLLKRKESLLIYPAGSLKKKNEEVLGGASGAHKILQEAPDVNVVLVRTTGLWGSSFSRALTGKSPDVMKVFFNAMKILLKNFLFFAPRRDILVECLPNPPDFPWNADRQTLNRYLENWYNDKGPEPLKLVSYSLFKKEFPRVYMPPKEEEIPLDNVPNEIKERIIEEIAELSGKSKQEISPEMHLAMDLGFDSLDLSQLVIVIKENFGIPSLQSSDLTTVGSVMLFAARLKSGKKDEERNGRPLQKWDKEKKRPLVSYPEAETLIAAFLKTCDRMDSFVACADKISGEVTYQRFKLAVILLAKKIAQVPGERIGVMMPASIAVNMIIFAIMLAGKVPVMINWTLGSRNLRAVLEQSQIQATISSWAFLDRLDNVELDGIDEQILLIEDMRKSISLLNLIKGFFLSKKEGKKLLKYFGSDKRPEDLAVILFTSGTESYPKGVPLSHYNIMNNQKGALESATVQTHDVMLGVLPPFHSFGFSVTGLFPLIAGIRVAFSPNPTDGKKMALAIKKWKVTLLCIAPSFLRNLLRVANKTQTKSLHLVVTGAEKTPPEIYEKMKELNPKTKIIEGYGITECSPILTLNPLKKTSAGVGLPFANVEIMIVHPETLDPLPQGEAGLILTRGPNVFSGYLDPQLESPFIEAEGKKWYRTGDLGYLNEEGYLILSGRLKRFVKIGGEMLSLTAIEETLLSAAQQEGWPIDPELPSLAAIAVEDEGKKSEIHLFTTFETSTTTINQVLKQKGMSNLIRISSIKQVPVIPLLGTGKIDYRALTSLIKGANHLSSEKN